MSRASSFCCYCCCCWSSNSQIQYLFRTNTATPKNLQFTAFALLCYIYILFVTTFVLFLILSLFRPHSPSRSLALFSIQQFPPWVFVLLLAAQKIMYECVYCTVYNVFIFDLRSRSRAHLLKTRFSRTYPHRMRSSLFCER